MSDPTKPKRARPKRTLNEDPLIISMVRWLLILLCVVIGWSVVSYLAGILAPILVALGIAYMLDPVLEKLVARGMSRALGATLLLVVFLGTVGLVLAFLIPAAIDQIRSFINDLPSMITRVTAWIKARTGHDVSTDLKGDQLKALLEKVEGPLEHFAEVAVGSVFEILGVVVEGLLIPVFAFYFLLDWPHMKARVIKVVPPRRRAAFVDLLGEIDGVVSGWIRGQAIVTSTLAVLYALAFWLIGVPLGVPIGFLVGALTIIPFVGTFVGAAITMLVLLLDWHGGTMIAEVAAVFVAFHLLEAAVLTPKITGHKVGLSESGALFAVIAGGKLLGFVGVVLAVPIAATVAVLIRAAIRQYERSEFFGTEADAVVAVSPAMALVMTDEHAAGTVRVTAEQAAMSEDDE